MRLVSSFCIDGVARNPKLLAIFSHFLLNRKLCDFCNNQRREKTIIIITSRNDWTQTSRSPSWMRPTLYPVHDDTFAVATAVWTPPFDCIKPIYWQRYRCRCHHSVWMNFKGFNWPVCGQYPNSLEFSLEFWWYNYNRWKQELVIQMFQINVVVVACYTPTTHLKPLELLK